MTNTMTEERLKKVSAVVEDRSRRYESEEHHRNECRRFD